MQLPSVANLLITIMAILTPAISAIVGCITNYKISKLGHEQEIKKDFYLHKRELFEKYLSECANCLITKNKTYEFADLHYSVLYQVPSDLREQIKLFCLLIETEDYAKAENTLTTIAEKLGDLDDSQNKSLFR